jgi:small-conductance mechanosensitive channel
MSAKVDQFCDKLRDRLNAIEGWVESVKADAKSRAGQAEKALREKLAEARARLQGQKERVEQAGARLKAWAEQKVVETREVIDEWKAGHEARKLAARADRAEAYAADAVACALTSLDEAEAAILEALVARREADAVREPAPSV